MKTPLALAAFLTLTAFAQPAIATAPVTSLAAPGMPRPAHVVIVIEENHTYAQIIGAHAAPHLTRFARESANFVNAHGITHPSAPNYFALFAGRTVTSGDDCPARGIGPTDPNLGSELLRAHLGFVAYSEALPSPGFRGCWAGTYARKHAPWAGFANLPPQSHQPLSAMHGFGSLPTVAFIVPDVDDDMHDGSVAAGDAWFATHLLPLATWADRNNGLLIVLWDEGFDNANTIPTLFYGPMVKPGAYAEPMNAYVVLRTIEAMYGLAPLGNAAHVRPVTDIWH